MRKLTKDVMIDVTAEIEKFERLIKDGFISKEIACYVKNCNHEDDNVNKEFFCVNRCDGAPEFALSLTEGAVIKDFGVITKEDFLKLTILLEDSSLIVLVAKEDDDIEFLLDTVRELFLYSEVV